MTWDQEEDKGEYEGGGGRKQRQGRVYGRRIETEEKQNKK